MKCVLARVWFLVAIAVIPLTSALLYLGLQDGDANDFHPPDGSLWQAYYWVADTPLGSFGLENWRLEGVNTHTAIHLGTFSYYDIPLSAPAVAAIGFAAISTFGLLFLLLWPMSSASTKTRSA